MNDYLIGLFFLVLLIGCLITAFIVSPTIGCLLLLVYIWAFVKFRN